MHFPSVLLITSNCDGREKLSWQASFWKQEDFVDYSSITRRLTPWRELSNNLKLLSKLVLNENDH